MDSKRRKLSQSLAAGEDPVVTALDVVHELNELTEEAHAVSEADWGDEKCACLSFLQKQQVVVVQWLARFPGQSRIS